MSKCKGCGKILQNEFKDKLGYTPNLSNKLCERCFKIKNYNYHDNNENIMSNDEIINGINKKGACTLFLCDVLNLNEENINIYNKINKPKVLVVTKVDVLPKNLDLEVFRKNIKKDYKIKDVIFSSVKTLAVESKIEKYFENNKKIVMAGPTSSGKSSLINYLFGEDLTVSHYKNTTLEFINLKYEDKTIIDAPGFNYPGMNDPLRLNGMIKTKTMIIKSGYEVCFDKYKLYMDKDCNVTFYFPNDIIISSRKVRTGYSNQIKLKNKHDLVINGIGFIYFKEGTIININDKNGVSTRESLVASHE